jgi:hypothetical protein
MQDMSLETFTETFPTFVNRKLRIDTKTQMICVLEVIQLVSGISQSDASTVFRRLETKPGTSSNLQTKCRRIKINNKGNITPVADAATMIEIIWELPGKTAASFRRESAHYIARILGGDRTLIDEIEMRYDRTPVDQKEFMTANVERAVLPSRGVEELDLVRKRKLQDLDIVNQELALDERRCALQQRQCEVQQLRLEMPDMVTARHLDVLNAQRTALEAIGMFDTKAKFAISDSIKNYDPMGDPTTQQICGAKKELWTVSEIVERHMKQLMHTYTKHKSQVGKIVTNGYRAKYNTNPTNKSIQKVDGRDCQVNAYKEKDFIWILPILEQWARSLLLKCN